MSWPDLLISGGAFILGVVSFYWVSIRPERRQRREFYSEAMGRAATPGFPGRKSIFERLDSIEVSLAAPLLNGRGDELLATVERLDERTERQDRQIASIQRAMHIPQPRRSKTSAQ